MEQAICVAKWQSADFGRGRGTAIVVDRAGAYDWRLYVHDGRRRPFQKFATEHSAMRAFRQAVRRYDSPRP